MKRSLTPHSTHSALLQRDTMTNRAWSVPEKLDHFSKCYLTILIVIDVSVKASADYQILVKDLLDNEAFYGPIEPNSLVVGYTGWSKRWYEEKAYRNANIDGNMLFPTFSLDAIDYLLKKDIVGIAIDTFAPEGITPTTNYAVHQRLFGANKYIIENLANAFLLPVRGAYIIALPLKIEDGEEAPARIIGLIPKDL